MTPMHDGELAIDTALVQRLVSEQFPRFGQVPVEPVASIGTMNAIYRLGDAWCVRLPRLPKWSGALHREWRWLTRFGSGLPLAVPEPVVKGRPTAWYPCSWAIYRWIDGAPYHEGLVADERDAALRLARFVAALRQRDMPRWAPRAGRGPLVTLDAATRTALQSSAGVIDVKGATRAWREALLAPPWDGRPTWIHADLLPTNLLVSQRRLAAVLDFGAVGIGDPAADLIPAWTVFGQQGRAAFRAALNPAPGTWDRARGLALHQAALIIPYYRHTNPAFAAAAQATIAAVLADLDSNRGGPSPT